MTHTTELSDRVERVEAELKRWRLFGATCACLAVVAVSVAAAPNEDVPTIIKAREFQLIGDDGHVAGKLEVLESGAYLRLNEANGFSSAMITANHQRAGLYLENQDRLNTAAIEAYLGGGTVGVARKSDDGRYTAQLLGGNEGTELRLARPDEVERVITGD